MDARLVASRMPGLAMYGTPYAGQPFPGYLPYGSPADPSSFYNAMPAGENSEAWRAGLTQAAAAAYYEPQLAAHYGYGYGPMGLADGARRKNATRETTSTLKAWLNEHRKNPYPTKGEKIMLAIITKMTLTQVSTWFANARRRLKKENKMTWSPRNRCGEDDDDDIMDDADGTCDINNANNNNHNHSGSENSAKNGETSGNSRSSSPAPSGSERMPFGVGPHPPNAYLRIQRDGENALKSSQEEEEIDLEGLDEDKKEMMMGKSAGDLRRQSNDFSLQLQRQQLTSPKSASLLQSRMPLPHHRQMPPGSRFPLPPHLMPTQHPASKPTPFPTSNAERTGKLASPTSSTASLPSSMSSPTKPKIWSLADVATSSDAPKNRGPSPTSSNNQGVSSPPGPPRPPGLGPNPNFQHEAIRNWVDGVMQQQKQMAMAAAAMAGAHPHAFLPNGGGMMPSNLAAALNPAAFAALSRGNSEQMENKRFHPYGFADFAAVQQRATLAAAQAAGMSLPNNTKSESPPSSSTIFNVSQPHSPEGARVEQIPSPTVSDRISPARQMENTVLPTSRPSSNDSGIASAEASKEMKHK